MKRTILAASICLPLTAAGAFAASDQMIEKVGQILDDNGFTEVAPATLSDDQMSYIYLRATSTDNSARLEKQIEKAISPDMADITLLPASVLTDDTAELVISFTYEKNFRKEVQDILDQHGYSSLDAGDLSGPQVAEIYLAGTAGGDTDVRRAIKSVLQS